MPATALALLALGSLGIPARAQERARFSNVKLEARVDCPWPDTTRRGYLPAIVELHNGESRPLEVELVASCMAWSTSIVESRVEVPAGDAARVELFFPLLLHGGLYSLELRTEGETQSVFLQGTFGTRDARLYSVVIVTEETASSARIDQWTQDFAWADIEVEGTTRANVGLSVVSSARLPRRLESYTSLDAVVLDARSPIDAAALAPAFQWGRLGGLVAILGPGAHARAESVPELAEWMEPRFASEDPAGDLFAFGLGQLLVGETETFPGTPSGLGLLRRKGLVPDPERGPYGHELVVPGTQAASPQILILLMILFAIAIGPVNFLLVRRTKKPARLLVTVPLLSVGTSLFVLGYGFAAQGVGVRASSLSMTLLDQRAHRADSVQLRSFFASLSPGDGLAPGPGTVAFANRLPGDDERGSFHIAIGPQVLLGGDFQPVRRASSYVALAESSARSRLVFRETPAGIEVENGFPVALESLEVRDTDGALHHLARRLGAGERGVLESGPISGGSSVAVRFGLSALFPFSSGPQSLTGGPIVLAPARGKLLAGPDFTFVGGLPPASYVAVVLESPFDDELGLAVSEEQGFHLIVGVDAAEDWR